jgi:DNA-directed RNA polymerase specialized sigma24 family protein
MSALTNDELLRTSVASVDRTELDHLVRQNVDFVYATARRQVGDAHLAEDVTQAVFLVLLQKRAPVKPQHLSGWLFKTTRYAAANAKRMQIRRTHYEYRAPVRMSESASDSEPDAMMEMLNEALASRGRETGRL